MRIDHVAIWTDKLEEMRSFYITYFGGISNTKYINRHKGFESYFIYFKGNTSLEIMKRVDIMERPSGEYMGLCHLAFTIENKEKLHELTERLRTDGFVVAGEPRLTGDGFYESVILDVDNNRIELVADKKEE